MSASLRLLLVEDSSDDAALLIRSLEKHGYAPVHRRVESRAGLVAALEESTWDVALIDYALPGFGGLEALEAIRSFGKPLGVVIVSGTISEEAAVAALGAGAHDYVLKDNLRRLGPAVDHALREARQRVRQQWAEEELRKSEAKHRRLHQSMRDGFMSTDMNGRILECNQAFQEMVGYAAEELVALPYLDLIPDKWHTAESRIMKDQVLARGYSDVYEKEYRRKDGKCIPVEVRRVLLKDSGDSQSSIWTTIREIAERKNLESQLLQAQKMEAIGQLAGGIAHDFNNMLTAIIGFATYLQLKLEDGPLRHSAEQIIMASEKASQLTQGLLAFSRKQVVDPKPVDLNAVIRPAQKLLTRMIGDDVELSARLSDEELIIMADAGQVEQILMNLATNSRDAMPGGGSIIVSTSLQKLDEAFARLHGYGEPGPYAVMSFEDTGQGIEKENLERIFEPFFTTKDVGKGTGLGLAIVYSIVKQSSGYINVYSEIGKGTTFRVYFPIVCAPVEAAEAAQTTQPKQGTETILLGEDDPQVRHLTRLILEEFGYTVVEAVDGEDALEKYRAHRKEIRMAILDLMMPKLSGKAVADQMAQESPEKPVLFTSGYTANIIHGKEILERGLHFLTKPFSPDVLLRKVREILDQ